MSAISLEGVLSRVLFVLGAGRQALAWQGSASPVGEKGARGGPALFLDRDGTLLEEVPYLRDPREARLIAGVGTALGAASRAGYRLVVVTNQSGVARGLFGCAEVAEIHRMIETHLRAAGANIERFMVCPHHPEFTGECTCRKPEPGLLLEAARELDIDLGRSFMIGDTVEDLRAGAGAGCRSVLVRTGHGARQAQERTEEMPEGASEAKDLVGAVREVLRGVSGVVPEARRRRRGMRLTRNSH